MADGNYRNKGIHNKQDRLYSLHGLLYSVSLHHQHICSHGIDFVE